MIVTTLVLLGPILLLLRRWARAVRRGHADLPRLRAAREHHDLVPRHRPDHPADRSRASRSTASSSGSRRTRRRAADAGRHPRGRPAPRPRCCGSPTTPCWRWTRASAGSRRCGSARSIVGIMTGFGVRVPGRAAVLRPAARRRPTTVTSRSQVRDLRRAGMSKADSTAWSRKNATTSAERFEMYW